MSKIIDHSITLVVGNDIDEIVSENKKHINRFIKDKKLQNNDYRVLIVDFKNKYKGTKVKIEDLPKFKNKTCIIGSSEMSNSEKISLLEQVCYNYKNGLLVIDDFYEIKREEINCLDSVIAMLTINRTPQRDLIISFGDSIDNIPTKLSVNSDYFRIHYSKNFDKARVHNAELFEISKSIINHKRKYLSISKSVVVSIRENKIFGCGEKEYIQGVKSYIYDRLYEIQNFKSLNEFNKYIIDDKYFLNQKHIPISNVNRFYK